jgi:hypothetical protein
MSLLQQDSSGLGESYTRGTSHVLLAAAAAAVLVSAAIAAYMIAGEKPRAATGEVIAVWAHPQHTETSGLDASGGSMPKEIVDQVMVFAEVRLHNQSNAPLFLSNVLTNATLPDGIHSSYAASPSDYDRMFVVYPELPVPHGKALALYTTIEAGQTVEGTVVSAFRMTRQQFDARKDLSFTFGFRYQPSLVLTPRVSVIEQ